MDISQKSTAVNQRVGYALDEIHSQPFCKTNGNSPQSPERDSVTLTANGKKFAATLQQMRNVPDVREDRIMKIKRQMEAGTYTVNGDRIAVNMIDESMENNEALQRTDPN